MLKPPPKIDSKSFVHWLSGFIDGKENLTQEQVKKLKDSLNGVFYHEIDPTHPDPDGKLQDIHDGKRSIRGIILDEIDHSPLTPEQEEVIKEIVNTQKNPRDVKYMC